MFVKIQLAFCWVVERNRCSSNVRVEVNNFSNHEITRRQRSETLRNDFRVERSRGSDRTDFFNRTGRQFDISEENLIDRINTIACEIVERDNLCRSDLITTGRVRII